MTRCQLYRWLGWLWLDDRRSCPSWMQRHLASCSACRQALELEQHLAQRLRTEARQQQSVLCTDELAARIETAIRTAPQESRARAALAGAWGWWAGLRWQTALAATALGIVVLSLILGQPPWRWGWQRADTLSPLARSGQVIERAVNVGAAIDQWGGTLEEPLTREVQLAMQDGQAALAGLLSQFVPESAAANLMQQARGWWHVSDASSRLPKP